MKRRKRSTIRRLGGLLGLLFLAWAAGFLWFVDRIPEAVEDETTRTDAIVVLTGGSERLPVGLALLEADLAERLFVSGVYSRVDVATILDVNDQARTTLACCIDLGHDARHTIGNARETAIWIASGDRTSMRLVTANYHMPRSLNLFRRAMPEIEIVPHPVFPDSVRIDSWWSHPRTFALLADEYTKYLVSLIWPPP
ncbi:MAG: YdcF family protein [Rhodospirillales bacterium]|nr:YdcF family protein [Rhodospirillales bacterium]